MSKNFMGTALDTLGPSTHSEQKKRDTSFMLAFTNLLLLVFMSIYLFV